MVRSAKNAQRGFSLIELMVVVAIIGILATIAIPRVNRFIAKSRTSEAQVNLSSLYTFNKNFFVEYQGYTNAFAAMGYGPEGKLRYNIGWPGTVFRPPAYTAMGRPTTNSTTNTADWCGVITTGTTAAGATPAVDTCDLIPGPGRTGAETLPTSGTCQTLVSESAFRAGAVAQLAAGDDVDTWCIDEMKNLNNSLDGANGILGQ